MLQVGMKLWYVPKGNHGRQPEPFEVTVMSIGRKWAKVSKENNVNYQFRIDINDMYADGGLYTSPGKCWYSKDLWEEYIENQRLWKAFRKRLDTFYNAPKNLTSGEIKALFENSLNWE